jgi:replication factor A1
MSSFVNNKLVSYLPLQNHHLNFYLFKSFLALKCRFRVECIVIDVHDVTSFIMVGKTVENFFCSTAHHYVYDKGFCDPSTAPPAMIAKLNKSWIFQLHFGAFRPALNRCEIVVANVFDDIEPPTTPAMCVQSQPASNITPSFSEATASISFTQPTPTTIPALPASSSVSSQVTSSDAHQEFDKANLTGTKRRLDFHDESDQPRYTTVLA